MWFFFFRAAYRFRTRSTVFLRRKIFSIPCRVRNGRRRKTLNGENERIDTVQTFSGRTRTVIHFVGLFFDDNASVVVPDWSRLRANVPRSSRAFTAETVDRGLAHKAYRALARWKRRGQWQCIGFRARRRRVPDDVGIVVEDDAIEARSTRAGRARSRLPLPPVAEDGTRGYRTDGPRRRRSVDARNPVGPAWEANASRTRLCRRRAPRRRRVQGRVGRSVEWNTDSRGRQRYLTIYWSLAVRPQ